MAMMIIMIVIMIVVMITQPLPWILSISFIFLQKVDGYVFSDGMRIGLHYDVIFKLT